MWNKTVSTMINNRRTFLKSSLFATLGITPFVSKSAVSRSRQNKKLPVSLETDVCVVGGSCTGVFAAISAARLGAKVCIVEKQNAFGGTATNSMVFVWHSLMNTEFNQQIIAGLTQETMDRLKIRNAVKTYDRSESEGFRFNSQELKIELDEMVLEHNIEPFFHTAFSEPVIDDDGELTGIIIENKDGRSIIKAKQFIDASGDGDLAYRLGLKNYTSDIMLPPTTCAHFEGWQSVRKEVSKLMKEHGKEFDMPLGYIWGNKIPGSETSMIAGTRVFDADCSKAADLTRAEMEGRRQVRAIMDLIRKYIPDNKVTLTGLPSHIGIRQTRQFKCQYQLTGNDVLHGVRFDDAVANGSYRVDIHHHNKPGITFRYLDGREAYSCPGQPKEYGRWRPETSENPTFYQVPLRSLIPGKYDNLILAGRMLDADPVAFSGARVMVNMNQLGEAAGTAAYLALEQNKAIEKVNPQKVREVLKNNGSIIL